MGVDREDIDLNTNLNTDLFFDNDDMNIFLFFVETKFKIDVKDKEIMQLQTVNNTINFIEKKAGIQ